jgi:hypothetical protein
VTTLSLPRFIVAIARFGKLGQVCRALLAGWLVDAAGCANARGRFEDFQNRLPALSDAGADDAEGGAQTCDPPPPNTVFGPALLAVGTSLIPGKPILFLGQIETPELGGSTAVQFSYRALDSSDRRTRVGPELEVGPYPLKGGLLVAPIAESSLDGRANPQLYGAEIDSQMTLTGQICGVARFYCGTLTGETTGLISGPFTGDFGITLLDSEDALPDRPRFGCAAADLAAPLPTR